MTKLIPISKIINKLKFKLNEYKQRAWVCKQLLIRKHKIKLLKLILNTLTKNYFKNKKHNAIFIRHHNYKITNITGEINHTIFIKMKN